MNRETISDYVKGTVIVLGAVCLTLALVYLPVGSVSWGFLIVLVLALFVAPRISLTLPRSKFTISFSDLIIFLSFLVYGGEMAILTAFVVTVANCVYLKSRKIISGSLIVLFNSSLTAIVTAVSYGVLILCFGASEPNLQVVDTRTLVAILGLLSLSQFFASSIFVAVYRNIKTNGSVWEIWKKQCLPSSLTQFVGAGLAGIAYKLIHSSDFLVIGIAAVGLTLVYISYRQSIGEVNEAINQAEEAERAKAETERTLRIEAETNASKLAVALEKEELANDALRQSEKDLQHAALYDALTNLANRRHFGDVLRKLIDEYKADPSKTFQVLFLDIRKFKNINDSLGHTLGDRILTIAAKRFVGMLNSTDMVARIGGDEFAVILKNVSTSGKAMKVARRLYDHIAQPFSLSGNHISISVNIGIAPCDIEYNSPEEVLRDADIAMHYAKEKNTGIELFTKELRVRFLERIRLENDLRIAIDRDELSMYYQPLVNIQDGSLLGFEALLRWNHREFGNIPPNKFIPIAEESGLIIPITVWILQETANQLAKWQKISPTYNDLIVSVNISGKHLSNDDLIDDVENALASSKISPSCLKLEITESAAMENAEFTISVLNRLKHLGVQLSIDDFGTGYSSLSYLHRLPFDTLKIDRSFVYSVGESGENSEILQTIISLAKSLKKKVIAEGIETESQLSLLQNLGCDYGQGYLLARPQTKENTEKALYERKRWLPDGPEDATYDAPETASVEENLPVF